MPCSQAWRRHWRRTTAKAIGWDQAQQRSLQRRRRLFCVMAQRGLVSLEVRIVAPAQAITHPIQARLDQRTHRLAQCALLRVQPCLAQRIAVLALQVFDDQRRVGDDHAVVQNRGQLAQRLLHVLAVGRGIRNAGHAEPGFQLDDKGADVRTAADRPELVDGQHRERSHTRKIRPLEHEGPVRCCRARPGASLAAVTSPAG
jgi:hypothetical protein